MKSKFKLFLLIEALIKFKNDICMPAKPINPFSNYQRSNFSFTASQIKKSFALRRWHPQCNNNFDTFGIYF